MRQRVTRVSIIAIITALVTAFVACGQPDPDESIVIGHGGGIGSCGNLVTEPQNNEDCDDGNYDNTDACVFGYDGGKGYNYCQDASCGDGYVQVGVEDCDWGQNPTFAIVAFPGEPMCPKNCRYDFCGDGIVSLGEQCDDGNDNNLDACTNTCAANVCGDGFLFANVEQCDDGNTINDDTCTASCTLPRCGDGLVQAGETCEDGNTLNNDGCSDTCVVEVCGDGIKQANEACDDGNPIVTDGCIIDPANAVLCQVARCGDGYVFPTSEACDDGNTNDTDGCTNACSLASCGDGVVQAGEQCDDANASNSDGCLTTCLTASCGDGFIRAGVEQCDDANASNNDGCLATCVPAACGDGFRRNGVEQCDDANQINTDACTASCRTATCGDAIVRAGVEACDDGNTSNSDGCTNSCASSTCGDGFTQGLEQCDDANASNTDACLSTCLVATCGDGFLRTGMEQCDDGNSSNTDACVNIANQNLFCRNATCGDSFVEAGTEVCDDGNSTAGDGCSAACISEACGDGVVAAPETCDGGATGTATCDIDCTPASCGDGVRNSHAGEECDEGTQNSNTIRNACRLTCRLAACGDFIVDNGEECDLGAANGDDDFNGCRADCSLADSEARSGGVPACGNDNSASGQRGSLASAILVLGAFLLIRRRRGRSGKATIVALLAVGVLMPGTASADADGFQLSRFAPPPSLDDGLALSLPATLGNMQYSAALTLDFSDRPFVLKSASNTTATRDVVGSALLSHIDIALGLGDRFQVRLDLPITLTQSTESGTVGMDPYGAGSTALGDGRIGGAVRLIGNRDSGGSLGLGLDVVLPIGSQDDFAGDGGIGAEAHVMAAYALTSVTLAVDGGIALRPSNNFADTRVGSELQARVGAHFPVTKEVRLLTELATGVLLRDQMNANPPPPLEALGGLRFHVGSWVLGAGAGLGLSDALGTPAWRALVTVGRLGRSTDNVRDVRRPPPVIPVTPVAPEDTDPDKDGVHGIKDECPMVPEDKDAFEDENGCPDKDNDNDLVVDELDRCPLEPEDKDGFEDDNGCPDPDNDGDGVLDATDKCIDKPETRNGHQDEDGCPDEIPEKVRKFTGVIQGINFRVGSAELLKTSFRTLDGAVAVLKEFPDLKLEIQGHTDDSSVKKGGKFADNLELSQARAESVREYFISKGIDSGRLTAKGLGETTPIEAPAGLKGRKLTTARTKNRRVMFEIVTSAGSGMPAKP